MSGKDSTFASFLLLQQSTFNVCLGSLVSSAIFAPWHMAVNNPCNSSNPVKPCQTFNWCHGCHGCHPFFGQVSLPSTRCEKMEKLDIKSSNNNKQLDSTRAPKVLCSFFRISVLKRVSQSSRKNYEQTNIKHPSISVSHCASTVDSASRFHGSLCFGFLRSAGLRGPKGREANRRQIYLISYDLVDKWVPFWVSTASSRMLAAKTAAMASRVSLLSFKWRQWKSRHLQYRKYRMKVI